MGKTLNEIAKQLKDNSKKVQLIYAFNGTGKTRLSKEFKSLVAPKSDTEEEETAELKDKKILYYNAFTEDLFYWDNDLANDSEPKLKIHPNVFTKWVLEEQGQGNNIISYFQNYTDKKLNPIFNPEYITENTDDNNITISAFSEVKFSYQRGNDEPSNNIKISKGEESCFIWSIFYSLLNEAVEMLNTPEESDERTDQFDSLEYVFIDDPVTSLDDNHLIQLAVHLAGLIKKSDSGLKFMITTHNALFYNVLYNELNLKRKKGYYMLERFEDNTFELLEKDNDSNQSFSYHQHLIDTIKQAIANNSIEKYHFTLLRNLYEKSANFLGHEKWSDLLPDDKTVYASRIMNFYSHRSLSIDEIREPTQPEKETIKLLFNHLIDNAKFWKEA